jgi:hypothetical protein
MNISSKFAKEISLSLSENEHFDFNLVDLPNLEKFSLIAQDHDGCVVWKKMKERFPHILMKKI